ncbi:MAG: hypothetical protein ACI8XO_003639, partial [Verrucomicrobiales bacterium]
KKTTIVPLLGAHEFLYQHARLAKQSRRQAGDL